MANTKTNLADLNDHLFECLERLLDDDCNLDNEIQRAKAVSQVASVIVDNADLALRSYQFINDVEEANKITKTNNRKVPGMLTLRDDQKK